MRLTLRTLLAYLDELLEPADAEDIGRKIGESEYATSQVSRIRDVTRRLRLGAPKLSGRSAGLDSNSVAEYLDNTLSTKRVPEFEKACLESDVQLAEVASCHQILTLVLGEPAEVEQQIRERMYDTCPWSETVTETPAKASVPAPESKEALATGSESASARPRPEVPDYLRDTRTWRSRALIAASAVAVVGLIAVTIFFAITRDANPDTPIAQNESSSAKAEFVAENPETPRASESISEEPSVADAEPNLNVSSESTDASNAVESPVTDPPGEALPASAPAAIDEPLATPSESRATEQDAAAPLDEPPMPEVALPIDAEADVPLTDIPAAADPVNSTPDELAGPIEDEPPVPSEGDRPASQLGRFISPSEVLVKFDASANDWKRLSSNGILYPGDTILALPNFRSTVTLGAGVVVQLFGGTRVELDEVAPDGIPALRVHYGRVVMMTVGRAGVELRLQAGQRSGTLRFEDPGSSTVAVEVLPSRAEGSDPQSVPPRMAVNLYVAGGRVLWEDAAGGEPETLEAPATWHLLAPANDRVSEQPNDGEAEALPSWVLEPAPPSFAERRAAEELGDQLTLDRSVQLSLQELAQHRRVEIRALASEGLTHLDEFEPTIEAIGDRTQRTYWNAHVESLRLALARGPEVASKIRDALATHYPAAGEDLYRLLWGYTETQLREGEDALLVEYLDHKDVTFNVLAFWNLRDITGKGLHYRPHDKPADRQQGLRRWQQELSEGAIVPQSSDAATP